MSAIIAWTKRTSITTGAKPVASAAAVISGHPTLVIPCWLEFWGKTMFFRDSCSLLSWNTQEEKSTKIILSTTAYFGFIAHHLRAVTYLVLTFYLKQRQKTQPWQLNRRQLLFWYVTCKYLLALWSLDGKCIELWENPIIQWLY